jgi:hypothetical protein
MTGEEMKALAEAHVDWFLKAVRPLLIDNFIHGIQHGLEEAARSQPKVPPIFPWPPNPAIIPHAPWQPPTPVYTHPAGYEVVSTGTGPHGDTKLEPVPPVARDGDSDLYWDGERSGDY